jgi:hypothetical protein
MPCYQKQCPEKTKQCMHNISADAVMEKLAQALAIPNIID